MTSEGWRLNPDFIQWALLDSTASPVAAAENRALLLQPAPKDWFCKLLSARGNPSAHLSSVGAASTQILAEVIGRCWMASSENKCCWMFLPLLIRSKLYRQLSKIFLLWPVPFLINCWYVCVQEVKKAYLFLFFEYGAKRKIWSGGRRGKRREDRFTKTCK